MASRGTWQKAYSRKYALEVIRQEGLVIKEVRCKMCKYFGRQIETIGRKRGARTTDQFYSGKFRADTMTAHLAKQHATKWAEYQRLSPVEQDKFFDNVQPHANTMLRYMDMESDEINLKVSAQIVDEIIEMGDRNRMIEKLRSRALSLFKWNADEGFYTVTIKKVMRFQLTISHVSCGMSFRQVAAAVDHTKNICSMAKLSGLNDSIVGQYVRILVGHCLQVIATIMANDDVWAFALSFDGSTHRGTTFFDVRIRVAVNGVLHNLHLIAMPHFDRHTAENQEAMLVKLLNALFPGWTRKLIGITTDGERTNMGHINDLINATFVKLQSHDLVISQQRELLTQLVSDIRELFSVHQIVDDEDDFENMSVDDYVRRDGSFVLLTNLHEYVKDLGSRAQEHWAAIDDNERKNLQRTIARFAIGMSDRIAAVEAERSPANNAAIDLAPPVLPKDLVKIRSAVFIAKVIEPRKAHLQATAWTEEQIEAIEREHRDLLKSYRTDKGVQAMIDGHDHTTSFNAAWDEIGSASYHQLRRLCAGVATVFPNSTSVESDFSILKWELDQFRQCLLDLSLEGIFQSKQFELL
ncbi:hypothetical protein AeNC1_017167, partial [Aphanomyces euteiches]